MSATPRPWKFFPPPSTMVMAGGTDFEVDVVRSSGLSLDDARLIETAVNENDALVVKVAEVRAYAESLVFKGRGEPDEGDSVADYIAGELFSILSGEPTS